MRIMGPPSAQLDVVQRKLREQGRPAYFIDVMVPVLYKEGQRAGVDPVVMIAQSAKETGWGTFPGKVPLWFCNTAGIKISPEQQKLLKVLKDAAGITDPDHMLDHECFPSWTMGARAHAQHLRAYCGAPVPLEDVVHPRYFAVSRRISSVEQLSGNWAPSATYGAEVQRIALSLIEIGL
jgi:N-acetylmuramoyl-L-alanine amidase